MNKERRKSKKNISIDSVFITNDLIIYGRDKKMKTSKRFLAIVLSILLTLGLIPQQFIFASGQAAGHVVISQVYGGGGNSGAFYKNDFIELYNPTDQDIDLTGWTVQYASATGNFGSVLSSSNSTVLSGIIKKHGYYLIQQAAGTGAAADLPTPDAIGLIAMAGANAKVALVKNSNAISGKDDPSVVDFVGYGTANAFEGEVAAATSNTNSIARTPSWVDSNNNKNDFVSQAAAPRNSQSPVNIPDNLPSQDTLSIIHTQVQNANVGEAVTLSFQTTQPVTTSMVYYLTTGSVYEIAPVQAESTTGKTVVIPADQVMGDRIKYYIEASDGTQTVRKPENGEYVINLKDNSIPDVLPPQNLREVKALGAGKTVTVQGVAIQDYTSSIASLGCYIQDETGGIMLYDSANLPSIKAGDLVSAAGTTAEFNGKFELIKVTYIQILSNGNAVNASNILVDGVREENEGRLVKLSAVTLDSLTSDSYKNANIKLSKNGMTITAKLDSRRGDNYDKIAEKVKAGDIIDVLGIVEDANNGNYTLQLRSAEDISAATITYDDEAIAEDLFISEYVEGKGNNKAVEIYNGTGKEVNLSGYSVKLYINGQTTVNSSLSLTGTLADQGTYIVVNSGAAEALKSKGNISHSTATFNGNDAVALYKGDNLIDVVGKIGENPGTEWKLGDYSTLDKTLVRNYSVTKGSTAFSFLQWDLYEADYFDNIGVHVMKGNTLDKELPVILLTPIEKHNIARDLELEAKITDDRQVVSATLYYRAAGETAYKSAVMTKKLDEANKVIRNMYVARIPKSDLSLAGFEYYIVANDDVNTAFYPSDITMLQTLNLVDEDIDGPIIKDHLPKSGAVLDKTNTLPVISAIFEDKTGIDTGTFELRIDGKVIAPGDAAVTHEGFTYTPAVPLSQSTHKVEVRVKDLLGNEGSKDWSFTIGLVEYNHYRGQLHSHTAENSDGTGTLNEAYEYARDRGKADYFAVTDHSNWFDNDTTATLTSHTSTKWSNALAAADRYNENGKYVAIAGYEMTWSGSTGGWGHINTFNTEGFYSRNVAKINLPTYYSEIAKVPQSISQLNHPGTTFGDFADFGYYSVGTDAVTHLVEVGNGEGPVRTSGYFPSYEYYTRALDKGWHVAPSNNQDNHKGNWITSNEARTVVLANELTRENVYDAIRNYRVYASEDKNLEIAYYVNGNVMGTIMDAPDKLNVSIKAKDPDANDKIGKISIITNGGTVAASKTFDTNEAVWDLALDPEYSYYYVRIDQTDKDIAVTAPVWIGEVVPVGLSGVTASQSPTVAGETITLAAAAYNNSKTVLNNIKVEYFAGSMNAANKIGEAVIASIAAGGTGTANMTWKPEKAGSFDIYAATTINYNGIDKKFSTSQRISVKNAADITKVIIDTGHQNQYVSGDYAGKYLGLKKMLSDKEMILFESGGQMTKEILNNAAILIITAPQRVDKSASGLKAQKFEEAEIAAIAEFVKDGGSIILASRADYGDADPITAYEYQTTVQYNKILEAIDSNLRINDDQVVDFTKNGGQEYRLSFERYTSVLYNLLPLATDSKYSFYSGCSVVLKENGDASKVDWLVKGHVTTESSDADKKNDAVPVVKGDVNAIGAEQLAGGGKVVVAGSTFFSDFEVTGDNLNSNADITKAILSWMEAKKEVPVEPIAAVRIDLDDDNKADRFGEKVAVEGIVMSESEAYSKALGRSNAFFETIYVQDATAGITVFGISKAKLPIGTKVRIIGRVDEYQGDTEIAIQNEDTDLIVLDAKLNPIPPKAMSTGDSMLEKNEGWLVKVQGKVTRMEGTSLFIDDGTGEANVYVEGYIGNESGDSASLGKWDASIQIGDTVSAVGFCSEGLGNEKRLRVRNASEIIKITQNDGNNNSGNTGGNNGGSSNTGNSGGSNNSGSTSGSGGSSNVPEAKTSGGQNEVKLTVGEVNRSNKELVVKQADLELKLSSQILFGSLSESQKKDVQRIIELKAQKLDTKTAEEIQAGASVGADKKLADIGAGVISIEANIVRSGNKAESLMAFNSPAELSLDLSKAKIKDPSKLTGVKYVVNAKGEIEIQLFGGQYDEKTKNFAFFVNGPGNYGVLETDKLLQVSLRIDEHMTKVNGKSVSNDVAPAVINQRTMVPLRFIAENMSADVKWNKDSKKAVIILDGKVLEIEANKPLAGFDTPAIIQANRIFVPLRYVSDKLDGNVIWFPETKQVLIVK